MTEQHEREWKILVDINEQAYVECGDRSCKRQMPLAEAESRINEYETLKNRPSIKISDGDVWLVFPDAMISLDRILLSKPGPIVERNLRKWRDGILERKSER